MEAPAGIKWGSVVIGGNTLEGKIGIYVGVKESTKTNVKFHVEVWFATRYSCHDKTITLKFNSGENVSSASTTVVTSKLINHTDDTGLGWGSKNQTQLYEYDSTTGYDRRHTDRVIKFYASLSGIDMLNKTMYASTSYTILKKDSYKITFNANGGSGSPSSQTKWYGESLTLSSTKPTKTGYTFKGWSTSSSATSATWSAGGTYTRNESNTLYAVWQANTYTIKYNANGGSGAPSNQTKTHNKTLILSSTKPTRTNYNFEGWSTSSTATSAKYPAGGSYTDNKAATLYAVWTLAYTKPRITNFSVRRVNQNGQNDDQGTICNVIFNWATDNPISTDNPVTAIIVSYRQAITDASWSDIYLPAEGTSGSVSQNLSPKFSIENSYEIKVTVTDGDGSSYSSYATRTLPSAKFLIDFRAGGDGIAIGKAAENAGFDVYMDTKFEKEIDIYGSNPHLDFHYNNSTEDYTSRIIESASGKIDILANNGLFVNGSKVQTKSDLESIRLDLEVYNKNLRDFSYSMKYVPVIPAVFVRFYGVFDKELTNQTGGVQIIKFPNTFLDDYKPNYATALSVYSSKKITLVAKSDGIYVNIMDTGLKNYAVWGAGFWFV